MTETRIATTIDADMSAIGEVLDDLTARAKSFGSALTDALEDAVIDGESLQSVLTGLAGRLADIALAAGMKPLETLVSDGIGTLAGALSGAVTPFARGGIVTGPTGFAHAGGRGLMGEAGPEAILPLERTADGRLGVAAGGEAAAAPVIVHVHAQDMRSFARSQGQLAALLARTAGRGRRGL